MERAMYRQIPVQKEVRTAPAKSLVQQGAEDAKSCPNPAVLQGELLPAEPSGSPSRAGLVWLGCFSGQPAVIRHFLWVSHSHATGLFPPFRFALICFMWFNEAAPFPFINKLGVRN